MGWIKHTLNFDAFWSGYYYRSDNIYGAKGIVGWAKALCAHRYELREWAWEDPLPILPTTTRGMFFVGNHLTSRLTEGFEKLAAVIVASP